MNIILLKYSPIIVMKIGTNHLKIFVIIPCKQYEYKVRIFFY